MSKEGFHEAAEELPKSDLYIHTYTGRKFYLEPPRIEDIDILDIAHALSLINRFTGHTARAMPVVSHALVVHALINDKYAWEGLHHDDGEAYYNDLSSPLKALLGGSYRDFVGKIDPLIAERFGLDTSEGAHSAVKAADLRALQAEALFGLGQTFSNLPYADTSPMDVAYHIVRREAARTSVEAEHVFLRTHYSEFKKDMRNRRA